MDLLFKRYASPFSLINIVIKRHRLCEFVQKFVETGNDETVNETLWDLYLHRCFDKSFEEFKKSVLNPETKQVKKRDEDMDNKDIQSIVNKVLKKGK